MSISKSLRQRQNQHKAKNTRSKEDDKHIDQAMEKVIDYLSERFDFKKEFAKYDIVFESEILVSDMIGHIKKKKIRNEFDLRFMDRRIKPDGGALFLINIETSERQLLLVSEVKRQGTNDERAREGQKRQAVGNAIERLGKNQTGIRAMMCHEKLTPFVCFGSGCDFAETELTVLSKVSTLNEFYPLNRTFIFKRDGSSDTNFFSPVSMYFREEVWSADEMFNVMKEIAETAFRYYVY